MKWRSKSFTNLVLPDGLRKNSELEFVTFKKNTDPDSAGQSSVFHFNTEKTPSKSDSTVKRYIGTGNTIVTIIIVEARGLPDVPEDGFPSSVFCSFRLGEQTFRTKSVGNTRRPEWREQLILSLYDDNLLNISIWHKGKHKIFMGSCIQDLSHYERERTHDVWLTLDKGFGSVHMTITICHTKPVDVHVPSTSDTSDVKEIQDKYAFYNLSPNLEVIGQLFVRVIGARGLHGKPYAYCSLELDNEKIRTPSDHSSAEPIWNKSFVFKIYDITSVLEVKVLENTSFLGNFLGRVSIPLLRISDGKPRWYSLKDATRRKSAKGNCPRIHLEMSMIWNPVAASLKLFRPKQLQYIQEPPKFNLALFYKNVNVVRVIINFLQEANETFKRTFEWDNREYAFITLLAWIALCLYFSPWMIPLLLLIPFIYFWYNEQKRDLQYDMSMATPTISEDLDDESIPRIIQRMPEIMAYITVTIEYAVSVAERLLNLVTFKVPFLSWVTMIILVGSSFVFYYVPLKYLMMALGIYKFVRKQMNPSRILNNDLMDFISRIPDNRMLKDWRELSVPEPNNLIRSASSPT